MKKLSRDYSSLFLSLDGRIGRARWWFGAGILFTVDALVTSFLAHYCGPPDNWLAICVTRAALFRPFYAVCAKRFHDQNIDGSLALWGIVPYLTAQLATAFQVPSWFSDSQLILNALDLARAAVAVWFVLMLGLRKGENHKNRFDCVRHSSIADAYARGAFAPINERLFAYFVALGSILFLLAYWNALSRLLAGAVTIGVKFLAILTLGTDGRGGSFAVGVVLLGATTVLLAGRASIPIARLALRIWPIDPFGESRGRSGFVIGICGVVFVALAVPCAGALVYFWRLMQDFAAGWTAAADWTETTASELFFIVRHFAWFSCGATAALVVARAHKNAKSVLQQPFAMYLRRFSGFADRALTADLMKCVPPGMAVALVASRTDRPQNWDPFVWSFGGDWLIRPLASLPVQIWTSDGDWEHSVQRLLRRAHCVIIDMSDSSDSMHRERALVLGHVEPERVVALIDSRAAEVSLRDDLTLRALPYSPSWLRGVWVIFVKISIFLYVVVQNYDEGGLFLLLVVPFFLKPSIRRMERAAIKQAVSATLERPAAYVGTDADKITPASNALPAGGVGWPVRHHSGPCAWLSIFAFLTAVALLLEAMGVDVPVGVVDWLNPVASICNWTRLTQALGPYPSYLDGAATAIAGAFGAPIVGSFVVWLVAGLFPRRNPGFSFFVFIVPCLCAMQFTTLRAYEAMVDVFRDRGDMPREARTISKALHISQRMHTLDATASRLQQRLTVLMKRTGRDRDSPATLDQ